MKIVLENYSFHLIPADDSAPTREAIGSSQAVSDYLRELVGFLTDDDTSVRKFHFEQGRQPEAKLKLCALPTPTEFEAAADVLATRLHEKQRYAEVGNIKVQSGDLLTMYFTLDDQPFVLLAKLEHVSFLNRATWEKADGFPFSKNRVFKTCLCEMQDDNGQWAIGEVSIYDSNSVVSKFWWHDFLELSESTSDDTNSQRAYAAWKDFVEKEVRPTSKADAHILKNAIGCYFRNQQAYVHNDAVKALITNYVPLNPAVAPDKLSKKAQKLPQQKSLGKKFDTNFQINPKACRIRHYSIHLAPDIDLVLKAPVQDLQGVIKPMEDTDGKKGVFVVSETGFQEVSP